MRALVGICLLAAGAVVPVSAAAQETEALRKELEQMRRQFETMKDGYEKAINQLSDRLKTIESRPPQPAAAAPAAASPTAPATVPAVAGREQMLSQAQPGVTINPTELARPREPFALYERRGARPAPLRHRRERRLHREPHPEERPEERGTHFGAREPLLPTGSRCQSLRSDRPVCESRDPLRSGRKAARGAETSVSLAEAYPRADDPSVRNPAENGPDARAALDSSNLTHEHALPFIDRPNVMREFFGDEGLVEKGFEATWVPPLPIFLEVWAACSTVTTRPPFGRGSSEVSAGDRAASAHSSSLGIPARSSSAPQSPMGRRRSS